MLKRLARQECHFRIKTSFKGFNTPSVEKGEEGGVSLTRSPSVLSFSFLHLYNFNVLLVFLFFLLHAPPHPYSHLTNVNNSFINLKGVTNS